MRKLGCLHCGELSHFLVACPELQFTTKDQRWELSDLYQGGNPKQAQKLVREWHEAASAQAATATGKPGVSAKPAPAPPAVTAAKPPPPPQVATAPADAKRAPVPPAASASARAQSSAGPALAQIGAPLPQPQPNRRQQQLVVEDTRSSAPSESGSSLLASQSGSFLDQMVPGMTRQDSTASSSQTGKLAKFNMTTFMQCSCNLCNHVYSCNGLRNWSNPVCMRCMLRRSAVWVPVSPARSSSPPCVLSAIRPAVIQPLPPASITGHQPKGTFAQQGSRPQHCSHLQPVPGNAEPPAGLRAEQHWGHDSARTCT